MIWNLIVPCCVISIHMSLVSGQTPCPGKQIVTFNTGLTPFVFNYTTRRALIPQALAQTQADAVCLQEVWFETDLKLILDTVGSIFPYSWSPLHYTTTQYSRPKTGLWALFEQFITSTQAIPCSQRSSAPFVWCVLIECTSSPNSLFGCVLQNCISHVFSLPQTCLTCMVVGATDVCSTLSRCLGLSYIGNRVNVEGLLVLSKSRITSVKSGRYFPSVKQLLPRGYIQTQIENVGSLVCTHLSADLDAVSGVYVEAQVQATTGISSWEEQQRAEIQHVLANFQDPHVLAGDMNTGPAVPLTSVQAKFPNNYALFTNASYENDYVSRIGACTVCSTNPLRRSSSNSILDHVLLKGLSSVSSQRVLEGSNSGELLSDHFGVRVTICN